MPEAELVVGIVHVPGFVHRASMLAKTRAALADYTVVVACDTRGSSFVPEGCTVASDGLGDARNDLVALARKAGAAYLAIFDDDVLATAADVTALRNAIVIHPNYDLLAGVYAGEEILAHHILFDDRAATMTPVDDLEHAPAIPKRVHGVVQNAFIAKVKALPDAPWDSRAKMMEHELFAINLMLRDVRVGVVPAIALEHRPMPKSDQQFEAYEARRHEEPHYLGLLCLNLPKLHAFVTPSFRLSCVDRNVVRPLIRPEPVPLTQWWTNAADEDDLSPALPGMPVATTVLALIPTPHSHRAARVRLRATWLAHAHDLSVFDYHFVLGDTEATEATRAGDKLTVPLAEPDAYERLTVKLLEAYRDVLLHDEFQWLIKLDVDTWCKPLSLAAWLLSGACTTGYCGVLREHEVPARDADSWWTVPTELFARDMFPPYVTGGGVATRKQELERMLAAADADESLVLPMVEDASTGLWAEAAGVTPQHSDRFRERPPPAEQGRDAMALALACCDKDVFVYHRPASFHVCDKCDADEQAQRRALSHYDPATEGCGGPFIANGGDQWCCLPTARSGIRTTLSPFPPNHDPALILTRTTATTRSFTATSARTPRWACTLLKPAARHRTLTHSLCFTRSASARATRSALMPSVAQQSSALCLTSPIRHLRDGAATSRRHHPRRLTWAPRRRPRRPPRRRHSPHRRRRRRHPRRSWSCSWCSSCRSPARARPRPRSLRRSSRCSRRRSRRSPAK